LAAQHPGLNVVDPAKHDRESGLERGPESQQEVKGRVVDDYRHLETGSRIFRGEKPLKVRKVRLALVATGVKAFHMHVRLGTGQDSGQAFQDRGRPLVPNVIGKQNQYIFRRWRIRL